MTNSFAPIKASDLVGMLPNAPVILPPVKKEKLEAPLPPIH
jgi:hypothetical protein